MTTVTRHETPSQQVLAKSTEEFQIPDSAGRVFTIRKPGIIAQYRIIEVMGQSADIATYRGMVTPLIYICAIGDDPVSLPTNKIQLEALIQRVGDDGLEAVVGGIVKHFGKQDPEAEKAALKK